jgi:hypothetical protein
MNIVQYAVKHPQNRIELVNWRFHGAHESYIQIGVFGRNDKTGVRDEIEEEHDIERNEFDEVPDETYYVNDKITILSGDIVQHKGRKFRITITEVK